MSLWLRPASWIVPRHRRAAWRRRQEIRLDSLRILEERGELAGQAAFLRATACREAVGDACFLRWGAFDPWTWIRGPSFLIAAVSTALLLLAVLSHGFSVTRSLIAALRAGPYPDRPIALSVPIVFAVLTGAIAATQRLSLPRHGVRYLSFLVFKTFSVSSLLIVLWLEGGDALRAVIRNELVRALGGGLCLAIAFIVVFDCAVMWCLADQQYRCPDCLRRLVRPVRIGTWASIFEPPTTEWICQAGHGSMCEHERDVGQPNLWASLTSAPGCAE
jgi:hypothetical protein